MILATITVLGFLMNIKLAVKFWECCGVEEDEKGKYHAKDISFEASRFIVCLPFIIIGELVWLFALNIVCKALF